MKISKAPIFYQELDSLRGIMAMMVVLGHTLDCFCPMDYGANLWDAKNIFEFNFKLLALSLNGQGSVTFFFVLSGFLLSKSIENSLSKFNFGITYLAYLIRRYCRLMPAFIIALILAFLCVELIFLMGSPTDWKGMPSEIDSKHIWETITLKNILADLTLLSWYFNPVAWSLNVELYIGALIPLFVLWIRKTPFLGHIALILILLILPFKYPTYYLIAFAFCFYIGTLINQWGNKISVLVDKVGFTTCIIFAFLIYMLPNAFWSHRPPCVSLIESIAAAFIISLIVLRNNQCHKSILNNKYLNHLGKMSYSLYLCHYSILHLVQRIIFGNLITHPSLIQQFYCYILGAIIVVGITLLISNIIYRFIEKPGIILGKRISKSLQGKTISIEEGSVHAQ